MAKKQPQIKLIRLIFAVLSVTIRSVILIKLPSKQFKFSVIASEFTSEAIGRGVTIIVNSGVLPGIACFDKLNNHRSQ